MSGFPLVIAPSLRAQVTARIRDEILGGRLRPGQRLSVGALADGYGVSAMPVRDGLRQLEAEGLVETEARRWTRVAVPDERTITEVYPMIVALEALALTLAPADKDLDRLASCNDVLRRAVRDGDVGGCLRADEWFHGVLANRTGSTTLASTLATLRGRIRLLEGVYFQLSGRRQSPQEHDAILAALAARDIDGAQATLRRHWERGERLVRDSLTEKRGSKISWSDR